MHATTLRYGLMSIIAIACFLNPISLHAQDTEQTIRGILSEQAAAWNDGDIERFMTYYWKSDELQFLGSSGLISGWQATLDRYNRTYPDTQAMGHLRFELIRINKRGNQAATVVGRYHLTREGLDNLSGYFLLVFEEIGGKWLIVADSTH